MALLLIKPGDLPVATSVDTDAAVMVQNGDAVERATPQQVVDAGRPVASEAQAVTGTDNTTAMTPLTTRQAIDADTSGSVALAVAAAEAAEASALDAESAEEQTGLDALATAADRVQTGLDVVATAADRVQTGLDVAATAADAVATAADAAATAADRVQTGLDATSAAASAAAANLDAADAAISATAADASATAAEAAAAAAGNASGVTFTQAGTGAVQQTVQRKLEDVINVRDFGILGVTFEDDTVALERAIAEAMLNGRQVDLPVDRDLFITRPIVVQIGENLTPAVGTDIHFDRYNPLRLFSGSRRAIRAAPSFTGTEMLYFTFDEPLNRPGPYWSEVANINLDGGGVAQTGIHFEWTIDVRARDLAIYGVDDCLKFTGFGVADINRCVFRSTGKGINFEGGGGDSWVTKCDFFNDLRGVSIGPRGGNTYITSNIFNRQDDEVVAGTYPIAVFIQGDNSIFDTRDIRVHGNEFAGQDVGVFAQSTTGDTDVVRLSIQNNHLNPSQGGGLNTQALCELIRVTNPNICGNRIGSEIFPTPTSFRSRPAISLADCDGAVVSNNSFNNLWRPSFAAFDCSGLSYNGNNHRNIGLESNTSPTIYLENVTHSAVSNNIGRQTTSTASRNFIQEAGNSTANKGVGNVIENFPGLFSLAGGSTSTYS